MLPALDRLLRCVACVEECARVCARACAACGMWRATCETHTPALVTSVPRAQGHTRCWPNTPRPQHQAGCARVRATVSLLVKSCMCVCVCCQQRGRTWTRASWRRRCPCSSGGRGSAARGWWAPTRRGAAWWWGAPRRCPPRPPQPGGERRRVGGWLRARVRACVRACGCVPGCASTSTASIRRCAPGERSAPQQSHSSTGVRQRRKETHETDHAAKVVERGHHAQAAALLLEGDGRGGGGRGGGHRGGGRGCACAHRARGVGVGEAGRRQTQTQMGVGQRPGHVVVLCVVRAGVQHPMQHTRQRDRAKTGTRRCIAASAQHAADPASPQGASHAALHHINVARAV
jgi:hypothetical protein